MSAGKMMNKKILSHTVKSNVDTNGSLVFQPLLSPNIVELPGDTMTTRTPTTSTPVREDEIEDELNVSERYFDMSGVERIPIVERLPDGDANMQTPEGGEKEKGTVEDDTSSSDIGKRKNNTMEIKLFEKLTLKQKKKIKLEKRYGIKRPTKDKATKIKIKKIRTFSPLSFIQETITTTPVKRWPSSMVNRRERSMRISFKPCR